MKKPGFFLNISVGCKSYRRNPVSGRRAIARRKKQPDRFLYLAVPSEVYREFFLINFIQEVIAEHRLKLLVYEPSQQEIVLWKE